MHDMVIRGGTVVDGTGRAPFAADVAIDGGRISIVGTVGQPGREEIDATEHLVTPGFVDIHTHYDGQATWDPEMGPSAWHGVTSVVMGNCGVGFAPVRPHQCTIPSRLLRSGGSFRPCRLRLVRGWGLGRGQGERWGTLPLHHPADGPPPHAGEELSPQA